MRNPPGRWFIVISLALLCCCMGFAAPALAGGPIEYVLPSGTLDTCYEYTDMTALLSPSYPHKSGDELVLPYGWYAVTENTTIDKRVKIDGAVFLILCDDTTLTLSKGIHLAGNNQLDIFAQSGGSGWLVATGEESCSAIGGNADQPGGYMYVDGGNISATSNGMAAGIGGGGPGGGYTGSQTGGLLQVSRGTVTATATGGGAGIGCGAGAIVHGGYLDIYGGTVTARSTHWTGDGIGGDGIDGSHLKTITIGGGTRIASSNPDSNNTKAMAAERFDIADHIQVRGGNDAGSATLAVVTANSDGRPWACRQNYAKANGCDHAGHDPYYPVSAETHKFDCRYCKCNIAEEPHDFASFGGICSVCGMSKYAQVVLDPGEAGGQALAFFVDHGTYELPECPYSAPAGKVFKGWEYGDPAVVLQPGDPIDLPLTESVTLTALWEYPDLVVGAVTYTAWPDNKTLPSTSGCWYLPIDVDGMTDCWTVPQGNTILNLNGHRIWRGAIGQGMSEGGSVIRIPANATLTIRDTSGSNACIAGGNAPQGGCIYNAGKLYFESGRIGADQSDNANIANDGAAVYNTGTMVMSGGLIDHNKTLKYGGGAITNYGVFAITGGTISGNTSKTNGGGIWNSGTLTFGGGSITGNTAGDKGGGIYVKSSSSFRINDNVHVQGNTGSGGTNNVNLEGGAVIQVTDEVYSTSSIGLSVSEITVSNNITVSTGFSGKGSADSFFSDSASLATGVNEAGELILGIPKDLTLEPGDGTGTAYTVKVPYGGVCTLPECEFTPPEFQVFRGWQLSSTSDTLDSGDQITVTDAVTATAQWRPLWAVLQQQINEAANGDIIVLAFDAQADRFYLPLSIPSGKTLTIDLNGHTISRSLMSATSGGNVITVQGTLTITDSVGGGAISGGWNSKSGGAIVNSGTLTISGGTISDSKAPEGGAIQNNESGILNLVGGSLTGNQANSYGGAILNRGTIHMSGGTISGNTSRLNGAGIWTSGTVNLSGGTITGNTAGSGQNGAGLYYSEGTVNLSGAPVVWENTPNDLYLRSPMVITAAGALTSGLHIGIASEVWPAEGQPLTVVTGITAYAGGIVCHKPMYPSVVYPDGVLRMIVRPVFGTPDFTLPNGLATIEANAFEGAALVTVVDAHTCTAIGPEAFRNCTGLTQILLPANCAIDSTAFSGCSGPVFVFAPTGGQTEASCAAIPECVFLGE